MRNNFKAEVENRFKAKGLMGKDLTLAVDKEMSRVQIHHIIPDELIRNTELGKAAQKAGYNLDEASNLKGMPRNAGNRADELDTEHRGSHPNYTDEVREEIMTTIEHLKTKYETDSLDSVPTDVIKKEMHRIENKFRHKIQINDVPTNDGRLSFLPLQRRIIGGRYEVRV